MTMEQSEPHRQEEMQSLTLTGSGGEESIESSARSSIHSTDEHHEEKEDGVESDCEGDEQGSSDNSDNENICDSKQHSHCETLSKPKFSQSQSEQICLVTLEEVLELLPYAEKEAYLTAREKCPHLVDRESNLDAFLGREDYNVWAAVRRLVFYWKSRLDFFGPDRAFLPLLGDFSGRGALNEEDIQALKTGYHVILPRDEAGRPVMCLDVAKGWRQDLPLTVTPKKEEDGSIPLIGGFESFGRIFFFLRNVFAHEEQVQKQGYMAFVIYTKEYQEILRHPEFQRIINIIYEALPVSTKAVYLVQLAQWTYFQNVQPLLHSKLIQARFIAIPADSQEELLRKLQSCQFVASGLPPVLGGTFNLEQFHHWMNQWTPIHLPESLSEVDLDHPSQFVPPFSMLDDVTGTSQSALLLSPSPSQMNAIAFPGPENAASPQIPSNLADFYHALDVVPFEDKAAYVEALQLAPDLVSKESNPQAFMNCEKQHPWAAARRFINYWTQRRVIFGPQRAYLPLVLTGRGAMPEDEIPRLLSGHPNWFLPDDAQGRPVLCYNRARLSSNFENNQQRLRWLFYVVSVLTETPAAQSNGVVVILAVTPEFFSKAIAASFASHAKTTIKEAFPVNAVDIHLVCTPPKEEECDGNKICENRPSSPDMTSKTGVASSSSVSFLIDRYGRDANVHIARNKEELMGKLQEAGFKKAGVPEEFGGSWTAANNEKRWQERLQFEQNRQQAHDDWAASRSSTGNSSAKSSRSRLPKQSANSPDAKEPPTSNLPKLKYLQPHFEAALEGIPLDEKKDYVHAVNTVPNMVAADSNPQRYLALDPSDLRNDDTSGLADEKSYALAAARRLVTYWAVRRELFGEDRAFLPLDDLSGHGCLTQSDVSAWNSGNLVTLPEDNEERDGDGGRKVLWMNETSGRDDSMSPEERKGLLFYWLHTVSSSEKDEAKAVKPQTIVVLTPVSYDLMDDLRALEELARQCFAIRLLSAHLICASPESPAKRECVDVVIPATLQLFSKHCLEKIFIHVANTNEEMLLRLEACGFSRMRLPVTLGGGAHVGMGLRASERAEVTAKQNLREAGMPTDPLVEISDDWTKLGSEVGDAVAVKELPCATTAPQDPFQASVEPRHGTSASLSVVNTTSLDQGMEEMHMHENEAYLEAKNKSPSLILRETKLELFLRRSKGNTSSAARAVALHWKRRLQFFGPNRAFQPMHMTGEGAVSREAVAYLSTGALVILPNDKMGRSVLFFDPSRKFNRNVSPQREVMFYMAMLCARNEASVDKGVVLLMKAGDGDAQEIFGLLELVMYFPFAWHVIHVIPRLDMPNVTKSVGVWVRSALQRLSLLPKVVFHADDDQVKILARLQNEDLLDDGVPQNLGGKWSYIEHARWQERRLRLEWELPLKGTGSANVGSGESKAKRRCELTEAEKIERKRRYNVLHSRRKRERDRVEAEVMKKQVKELEDKKTDALEENKRLETLLREARREIMQVGSTQHILQDTPSNLWTQGRESFQEAATAAASACTPSTATASLMVPEPTPMAPPGMMSATYNSNGNVGYVPFPHVVRQQPDLHAQQHFPRNSLDSAPAHRHGLVNQFSGPASSLLRVQAAGASSASPPFSLQQGGYLGQYANFVAPQQVRAPSNAYAHPPVMDMYTDAPATYTHQHHALIDRSARAGLGQMSLDVPTSNAHLFAAAYSRPTPAHLYMGMGGHNPLPGAGMDMSSVNIPAAMSVPPGNFTGFVGAVDGGAFANHQQQHQQQQQFQHMMTAKAPPPPSTAATTLATAAGVPPPGTGTTTSWNRIIKNHPVAWPPMAANGGGGGGQQFWKGAP